MSKTRALSVSSLGCTVLAIACLSQVAAAEESPFGPIHVAANRSQYNGSGCPIEIVYTATINFVMPHPKGLVFNYHWQRSDGAQGPERVVKPSQGQRSLVLHDKWRLGGKGQQYNASETLFLNSGNTHLSESSPTVSVTCR